MRTVKAGKAAVASYSRASIIFLSALIWATTSSAQDPRPESRRIQAAVMLNGQSEPIIGEAHCQIDKRCAVVSHSDSGVEVAIDLHRRGAVESAEMTIRCPKDCSFTSGRSNVTFQSERKFDVFSGANDRLEILTVLRPRTKIGQIFLIVE